jgi:hypothetical protein
MENKEIQLDNEAQDLYAQLEGIEARELKGVLSQESDRLSQSLTDEEKKFDALRILLARLLDQISSLLQAENLSDWEESAKSNYKQIQNIFSKFSRSNHQSKSILIRYRSFFSGPDSLKKVEYEVLFGDIILDSDAALAMVKRQGAKVKHLPDQLTKAFEVFWNHGINNVYLKIPNKSLELKRMLFSLLTIAGYYESIKSSSSIDFKLGSKQFSLPLICNEKYTPDPNLTLLAGFNGLPPQKMESLVRKVDAWMKRAKSDKFGHQYTSVYNAIFGIESFQKKLVPPPIEVNNLKWLMVDSEQEVVSKKMAQVARVAMASSGDSNAKAAQVLKSVYGNDYEKIDSNQVIERLQATSDLLTTIEEKPENRQIEGEVLDNVEKRLDQVNDEVYDNLLIKGKAVKSKDVNKEAFVQRLHSKLFKLVSFYKKRFDTKKKMKAIVHRAIDFDSEDYETLAKDFAVSVQDAKELIDMLKSCFDSQGNFKRGSFARIVPEFARFERRIFEFLWHYLKETLHQKDRSIFLDSLQLMVDRLKQPKKSVSVLLEDLIRNPSKVKFSDRKAFMLANRLVRKYTHELISYQITPEDVLLVEEGLDLEVASYAAWKIDKNLEKFFEKIKTMHRRVMAALDPEDKSQGPMNAQYLLAQEREAYIFFSLVGGKTARSVIRSAVKEYGNSESEIYQLKKSKPHMADLLQLLKVAIRGLGRIGESSDLSLLDDVQNRIKMFMGRTGSLSQEELINQIIEWIEVSKQKIAQKN